MELEPRDKRLNCLMLNNDKVILRDITVRIELINNGEMAPNQEGVEYDTYPRGTSNFQLTVLIWTDEIGIITRLEIGLPGMGYHLYQELDVGPIKPDQTKIRVTKICDIDTTNPVLFNCRPKERCFNCSTL